MQPEIEMITYSEIHQPGKIDTSAIDTFHIKDGIVLQKTRVLGKIKMRLVIANIDTKMIGLVIMKFLVYIIA